MFRPVAAAVLAAFLVSAQPLEAAAPLEQQLKAIVQARVDAFGKGDGEAYRRLLRQTEEADYAYTNEAGQFRDAPDDGSDWAPDLIAAHPSGIVHSLQVQRYGDTAVATYALDARLTFNRETILKPFRVTEVFHRSGGKWRSVARHESVRPLRPNWRAEVAEDVLDDYVGTYVLLPTVDYEITLKDGRLYWGAPEQGVELHPESDATFATGEEGMGYRMIFLRESDGRVRGVRIREFSGTEYTAVRKG